MPCTKPATAATDATSEVHLSDGSLSNCQVEGIHRHSRAAMAVPVPACTSSRTRAAFPCAASCAGIGGQCPEGAEGRGCARSCCYSRNFHNCFGDFRFQRVSQGSPPLATPHRNECSGGNDDGAADDDADRSTGNCIFVVVVRAGRWGWGERCRGVGAVAAVRAAAALKRAAQGKRRW